MDDIKEDEEGNVVPEGDDMAYDIWRDGFTKEEWEEYKKSSI